MKVCLTGDLYILDFEESRSVETQMLQEWTGKKNPTHITLYPSNKFKESKFHKDAIELGNKSDIIFLPGGNTFYHAYFYRKYGLWNKIKKWANEGKVIVGFSAGAIMCTPTIQTAKWADNRGAVEEEFNDVDGLGLVDFALKPHSQDYLPRFTNAFQTFSTETNLPFKCLPDWSTIMVEDGKVTEIGNIKTFVPGGPLIVKPGENYPIYIPTAQEKWLQQKEEYNRREKRKAKFWWSRFFG